MDQEADDPEQASRDNQSEQKDPEEELTEPQKEKEPVPSSATINNQDENEAEEPKPSLQDARLEKIVQLTAFLELEKKRMADIEALIPHYELLRQDTKDKSGQTITYYNDFIEGCSIGHAVPAYFYHSFYKFNCLAAAQSAPPQVSKDVEDTSAPQSLHFWFKQIGDKEKFNYTDYLQWSSKESKDPKLDPLQYFLDNPTTEQIPSPSDFSHWPYQRNAFQIDYDNVPKKRVMFQPKKTANHELDIDFYVSPRLYIRYVKTWVTDVMYCNCFQFEALFIIKEVGGVWNIDSQLEKPYGLEFEIRSRYHILKPFKFEWVMQSQFEKSAKVSNETLFQPFVQRTFLSSMQENLNRKMYQLYSSKAT